MKKSKKELERLRKESKTNYESPVMDLSDYQLYYIDQKIIERAFRENEQHLINKIRVEINIFNESTNKKINHLLFSSQTGIFNLDLLGLTKKNEDNATESIGNFISENFLPHMVSEINKTLKEKILTYLQKLQEIRKEINND